MCYCAKIKEMMLLSRKYNESVISTFHRRYYTINSQPFVNHSSKYAKDNTSSHVGITMIRSLLILMSGHYTLIP